MALAMNMRAEENVSEHSPLLTLDMDGSGEDVDDLEHSISDDGSVSHDNEDSPSQLKLLLRLMKDYVIPDTNLYRIVAAISIVLVTANYVIVLLIPVAYKKFVDSLSQPVPEFPLSAMLLYFLARVIGAIFGSIENYCFAEFESANTCRLSVDMYKHLLNLSADFHTSRRTGTLSKLLDRACSSLESLSATVFYELMPLAFQVSIVILIFVNIGVSRIVFVLLCTFLIYWIFSVVMAKKVYVKKILQWYISWLNLIINKNMNRMEYRRIVNKLEDEQSEFLTPLKYVDVLTNYETVKSFGMEEEEVRKFSEVENRYQRCYARFCFFSECLQFGQNIIEIVGKSSSLCIAAISTIEGNLTAGQFVLIISYVSEIFSPILVLGQSYRQISQSVTDVEKCFRLFEVQPSVTDLPNAHVLSISKADRKRKKVFEIQFNNISFKYTAKNQMKSCLGSLHDVSFNAAAGQTTAIVGKSGIGKTTIIRLLLRLYDPQQGTILVDGLDIRMITQRSLRSHIAYVSQDTSLFNSTLRENITYGLKNVGEEDLLRVVDEVALRGLLARLPNGLDTMIGERGVKLSGGERQRVACARCILRSPAMVILDEASSALDTETEQTVHTALKKYCANRTTIIVAHRLSTIKHSNQIIVLGRLSEHDDDITVAEQGTHEELIQKGGGYASMWYSQL